MANETNENLHVDYNGQAVVKESGKQLKRDDSYRL